MSESIEILNKRLKDNYGLFEDGRQLWRIIFSDDEREIRYGNFVDYTPEGLFLKQITEFREVAKYSYIHHKYVLERLVPVPIPNLSELLENTSYEPVWTFTNNNNREMTPNWEAIEYLIHAVYEAAAPYMGVKYKRPESEENTPEAMNARIDRLQQELFGNESEITDALMQDSGVGFGIRKRNDSKE